MRILIVEDEYKLADVICNRLKKEKYDVDIAYDGEEGILSALSNAYDLILLDVMLPKKNGFDVLTSIKKNNIDAKIIMLTAKAELDDKLLGFTNGIDDYITKPFYLEELIARVNVQLRKKMNLKNPDILECYDLSLNLKTNTLTCITNNENIEVMCKELLILEYLFRNCKQIISKEILFDKIWGLDNEVYSNNLEAYISFIRKKIKIIGSNVNIKAIRGIGYKLEVLDEENKK